jgi:hypothetical protein
VGDILCILTVDFEFNKENKGIQKTEKEERAEDMVESEK